MLHFCFSAVFVLTIHDLILMYYLQFTTEDLKIFTHLF